MKTKVKRNRDAQPLPPPSQLPNIFRYYPGRISDQSLHSNFGDFPFLLITLILNSTPNAFLGAIRNFLLRLIPSLYSLSKNKKRDCEKENRHWARGIMACCSRLDFFPQPPLSPEL